MTAGESKHVRSDDVGLDDVAGARDPADKRTSPVAIAITAIAILLLAGSLYTARRSSAPSVVGPDPARVARVKTGDPNLVAVHGVALMTVTTPPSKTRIAIDRGRVSAEAAVDVAFSPYGRDSSAGLVLKVLETKPADSTRDSKRLADMISSQNLVADAGSAVQRAVPVGGTYAGRIELRSEGDRLLFVLATAEEAE